MTQAATAMAMSGLAELGRLFLNPPPASDLVGRVEYTRLFLNPQGAPCPPWQSLYQTGANGRTLMGETHHSALAWYRRYGFEPALENEPADHVGLLLMFYAHMIEQGASEADLGAFEASHLGWLGEFAGRLMAANPKEPFRSAGLALVASQMA